MYYCLDCQACETACPAGVKYGHLVELARVQVDKTNFNSGIGKLIKKFVFEVIFISKKRVKLLARLMRFYQRSGLRYLVRKTNILSLFSKKLAMWILLSIMKTSPLRSSLFLVSCLGVSTAPAFRRCLTDICRAVPFNHSSRQHPLK